MYSLGHRICIEQLTLQQSQDLSPQEMCNAQKATDNFYYRNDPSGDGIY